MERLTDGLKKILLAGIGTVAVTAEKSKEVLDEMVKRGELTVEQGKVLNQELKHNIKDTVKKNVNVSVIPSTAPAITTSIATVQCILILRSFLMHVNMPSKA